MYEHAQGVHVCGVHVMMCMLTCHRVVSVLLCAYVQGDVGVVSMSMRTLVSGV